jgi:hypothetical protein
VSPTYRMHPEFGLLCPSRSFRRKLWIAFAAGLAIIGALTLKVGHGPDADSASVAAAVRDPRSDAETDQTVGRAIVNAGMESSRPPEGTGKARKPQTPRAANEGAPIASVPLGRIDLPAPESIAAPFNSADGAHSGVATPVAPDPSAPSAPAPKKARKASHRNDAHDFPRDWPDDRWSARAYSLPDSRYRRDRYERSWGW